MPFMLQDILCPSYMSKVVIVSCALHCKKGRQNSSAVCIAVCSTVLTATHSFPFAAKLSNCQLRECIHPTEILHPIKNSWSLLQTFNVPYTCCTLSEKLKSSVQDLQEVSFHSPTASSHQSEYAFLFHLLERSHR